MLQITLHITQFENFIIHMKIEKYIKNYFVLYIGGRGGSRPWLGERQIENKLEL